VAKSQKVIIQLVQDDWPNKILAETQLELKEVIGAQHSKKLKLEAVDDGIKCMVNVNFKGVEQKTKEYV